MISNSFNETKHLADSKNAVSQKSDPFSDKVLIQSTIRVIAFTIALIFLFIFGDNFVRGIVGMYTGLLGDTSIDNRAMCDLILKAMRIVMAVLTAGFSIETLLRTINKHMRRN